MTHNHPHQSQTGITRRTVARGMAWTAPAVGIAAAAPAFAASPSLRFTLSCACKLPGGSCGIPGTKFGYNFYFSATNSGAAATVDSITFSQPKDLGATTDANFTLTYGGPSISVPVGSTNIPVEVLAQSTNSANQPFYTTMTVIYHHDGYANDSHTLQYCIVIKDTPPQCACNTQTGVISAPAACSNACAIDGPCPTSPLPTATSC